MILMGAGTNHWFHSDTIYRSFLALLILTGSRAQRRRLGALRRPGEGAPAHRLGDDGDRHRLVAPAAPDARRRRSGTCTPTSGATTRSAPTCWPARWARQVRRQAHDRTCWPRRRHGLDAVLPEVRPDQLDLADEADAGGTRRAEYVAEQLAAAQVGLRSGSGRPGELAAGADRVAGQPAGLLGQGRRVFPASTCWARTPTCRPRRPATACGRKT